MKIECPGCHLTGNIDDSTVPATGLAMTCPRCKKQFAVEKTSPSAEVAAEMMDSCPKCQYATFSEEKFAVCPKCGLVVADYRREQLALRTQPKRQAQTSAHVPPPPSAPRSLSQEDLQKEAEARRKHGIDVPPDVVEPDAELAVQRVSQDLPLPLLCAGWGAVVAALLLAVYGGFGIVEYFAKSAAAKKALEEFENVQSGLEIFFQYMLFPLFLIVYSLPLLIIAILFLKLKKAAIEPLHKFAWGGGILLSAMKLNDVFFWFKRASNDASFLYYVMGIAGDLLVVVIFAAPFVVLAEFLKSDHFDKTENLFF